MRIVAFQKAQKAVSTPARAAPVPFDVPFDVARAPIAPVHYPLLLEPHLAHSRWWRLHQKSTWPPQSPPHLAPNPAEATCATQQAGAHLQRAGGRAPCFFRPSGRGKAPQPRAPGGPEAAAMEAGGREQPSRCGKSPRLESGFLACPGTAPTLWTSLGPPAHPACAGTGLGGGQGSGRPRGEVAAAPPTCLHMHHEGSACRALLVGAALAGGGCAGVWRKMGSAPEVACRCRWFPNPVQLKPPRPRPPHLCLQGPRGG